MSPAGLHTYNHPSLSFLKLGFSKIIELFRLRITVNAIFFFTSLRNTCKQLVCSAWKREISQWYITIYTFESMAFCSRLPNMVSTLWLWRISRGIGANQKRRNTAQDYITVEEGLADQLIQVDRWIQVRHISIYQGLFKEWRSGERAKYLSDARFGLELSLPSLVPQ